ncbi:MAG: ETC complex I subunit [Rhizobiales bacterium]|nr:ETC complex I subunit [Hyphomicrobiales bacterium]MBI3672984.1 ETC complex I subunit [Hyphomicrobiales bacterium]
MAVRIYRPARNAMQSGKGKTAAWILEFEAAAPRTIDPLMGWTSSADTRQQLKLSFDSREEAVAYAERQGLAYTVAPEAPVRSQHKSYSDNFKWGRPDNWTH